MAFQPSNWKIGIKMLILFSSILIIKFARELQPKLWTYKIREQNTLHFIP